MKKHILIILCMVSVIILIIQITYTYSLFETDRDAVVVSPIAVKVISRISIKGLTPLIILLALFVAVQNIDSAEASDR